MRPNDYMKMSVTGGERVLVSKVRQRRGRPHGPDASCGFIGSATAGMPAAAAAPNYLSAAPGRLGRRRLSYPIAALGMFEIVVQRVPPPPAAWAAGERERE